MTPGSAVVVIGPSGVGKTAVGSALARRLRLPFVDADDLHPEGNVDRMRAGIALTDADRRPWLDAVGRALQHPGGVVVACSALAVRYRDRLRAACPDAVFLALDAPRDCVIERMTTRTHFMPVSLLDSQLATWEPLRPDERGETVDATAPLDAVVAAAASVVTAALATEGPERTDDGDRADGGDDADDGEHKV